MSIESLTLLSNIWLPPSRFHKRKLAGQHFVTKNSCTEFHENPTNTLVADIWSQPARGSESSIEQCLHSSVVHVSARFALYRFWYFYIKFVTFRTCCCVIMKARRSALRLSSLLCPENWVSWFLNISSSPTRQHGVTSPKTAAAIRTSILTDFLLAPLPPPIPVKRW
jgi:hypothetical protein